MPSIIDDYTSAAALVGRLDLNVPHSHTIRAWVGTAATEELAAAEIAARTAMYAAMDTVRERTGCASFRFRERRMAGFDFAPGTAPATMVPVAPGSRTHVPAPGTDLADLVDRANAACVDVAARTGVRGPAEVIIDSAAPRPALIAAAHADVHAPAEFWTPVADAGALVAAAREVGNAAAARGR